MLASADNLPAESASMYSSSTSPLNQPSTPCSDTSTSSLHCVGTTDDTNTRVPNSEVFTAICRPSSTDTFRTLCERGLPYLYTPLQSRQSLHKYLKVQAHSSFGGPGVGCGGDIGAQGNVNWYSCKNKMAGLPSGGGNLGTDSRDEMSQTHQRIFHQGGVKEENESDQDPS
jgi:hypothetical protein